MRRSKPIIIFIVLISFCLSFCNKNPLFKIEVHGRIIHALTKEPVSAELELWSGGKPHDKGSHFFESTSTNGEGKFDLKSKAGWNSDRYFLSIKANIPGVSIVIKQIDIKKGQNLDLGDVFVGP